MFDLTISIVTYKNDVAELMQAVDSALNTDLNVYLYIVDNSPTDELKVNFNDSRIEYIFNNANIGFGAGHNIAIKKAIGNSKYHLILNPDIYFKRNVLKELYDYMNQTDYGVLMPQVRDPEGSVRTTRRLLPTPLNIFGKLFPQKGWLKKKEREYRTEFVEYDRVVSAPFLSGGFMFCRTDAFDKVGLFDERYFMYMEDADLSRRFYSSSSTVYFPKVHVFHSAHRESHKSLKLLKIHLYSAYLYFNKWGWVYDRERKLINSEFKNKYKNTK